MDIAIIHGNLMTMKGNNLGIIDDGAIGIEDGRISYVGKTEGFDYKKADQVIDASLQIVMPGLINAHIHTGSTFLRGGAQDVPEIEWMNRAMGPIGRHLEKEDTILGAKLGVIEGIRSGTTTFGEYAREVKQLVKNVYIPFGTRVVATETINEISPVRDKLDPKDLYPFDRDKGEMEFKRARELSSFSHPLVDTMYGPQALDMISMDLYQAIAEQAREQDTSIHMHIAQGQRERLQIEGRYGKSTVAVLEEQDLLNHRLLGAHMHDTSPDERELMVERGVRMVSCQSSIAMIDGIVPPLAHYHQIGGIAALGTDQAPGPGNHNMIREMRTAALLAKTSIHDPTSLPAWEVLKLATLGAARALGIDQKVGSLEKGKKADVIMIDLRHPQLSPLVTRPFHTYVPNLVYSALGNEVSHVIIDGKMVVQDYQFSGINEQKVIDEVQKRGEEVFMQAEDDWRSAGSQLVAEVDKGNL